jgi:hypothetical protein
MGRKKVALLFIKKMFKPNRKAIALAIDHAYSEDGKTFRKFSRFENGNGIRNRARERERDAAS